MKMHAASTGMLTLRTIATTGYVQKQQALVSCITFMSLSNLTSSKYRLAFRTKLGLVPVHGHWTLRCAVVSVREYVFYVFFADFQKTWLFTFFGNDVSKSR